MIVTAAEPGPYRDDRDRPLGRRAGCCRSRRPSPRPAGSCPNRPCEAAVLRLLVAGYGTRAIGERLFVSPASAASHVASIYGKLGVASRAEATAFAHRHGLA